ncbi:class I SAM-dependent methyltransferase [Caproiciproducens faecalis]|uniref:Class I SAM-dependent methyltransferase n=1 Tax=Caproiciproducens faecalis TaxID=2820301 RepID=A0ABS7DMP4_9FIRM|nr:class I SAM-dependent methyltransferase [Caproiciproducens faecalis]MBW7572342.1 class I SAM-dependent methyltransferase [Caproiciproducens faecalis]
MASFDNAWEEIFQNQEWGRYPSEEVIRFIARNFYKKNRAQIKLLDIGCGTGAVTWYMAREGFAVYAFDGSETAAHKARQRMQEEGLYAHICVSDAASLPYSDDFFDGLVDSAAISGNTAENIKKILQECFRVLKTGGKLFSTGLFKVGMSGYGTGEKLEENTYREITEGNLAHRGTIHFFEEQEIRALWSQAGFQNIAIDSADRTEQGGQNRISYFMVEAQK